MKVAMVAPFARVRSVPPSKLNVERLVPASLWQIGVLMSPPVASVTVPMPVAWPTINPQLPLRLATPELVTVRNPVPCSPMISPAAAPV